MSTFYGDQNDDARAVELLLNQGIDSNAISQRGYKPLILAAHGHDRAIIRLLLAAGAKPSKAPSAIHYAARSGGAYEIEALVEHGTDVNHAYAGNDYVYPIHWAARRGNINALDALSRLGSDMSLQGNPWGFQALHIAVKFEHVETVSWLLKHGADPLVQDTQGHHAGHYAAEKPDGDILRLLLAAGIPLDARGENSKTMAMLAALADEPVCLGLLDAARANFDLRLECDPASGPP
jgi:ankyrin repeat protein